MLLNIVENALAYTSSGIGLSLACLIAQAHHGDIPVESEVTKGSCFRIWLPMAQEERSICLRKLDGALKTDENGAV